MTPADWAAIAIAAVPTLLLPVLIVWRLWAHIRRDVAYREGDYCCTSSSSQLAD